MARPALQTAGKQFPFDRSLEAQVQAGWRSERHKKGEDNLVSFGQDVDFGREMAKKNSLKFDERRANVYENKGPLLKTRGRDGNVIENKDSYADKAEMLLKIKVVSMVAWIRSLGLRRSLQQTADRQIGSAQPLMY